jgi:diguanylate cyclase (GGDEF)-like protein/excisionase family DNA binding protein
VTTPINPRPLDATLTVTKAARLLGVHPNTIRAWSDAGRLRYYRINPRGDRRYRLGDLQRFLAAAANRASGVSTGARPVRRGFAPAVLRPLDRDLDTLLVDPPRDATDVPAEHPPALAERSTGELRLLAELASLVENPRGEVERDLDSILGQAATRLRDALGLHAVAVWRVADGRLETRALAGPMHAVAVATGSDRGIAGRALELAEAEVRAGSDEGSQRPRSSVLEPIGVIEPPEAPSAPLISGTGGLARLATIIPGRTGPWGVLLGVGRRDVRFSPADGELFEAVARTLGTSIRIATAWSETDHRLHRADALRRVASDIGSRLELDQILARLVDHALVLFEADRAAVFLLKSDGTAIAEVSRGLSQAFLAAVRDFPRPSLPAAAIELRRPLFAVNYRDDPRGRAVRAAVVQEGFDTLCTAPLFDGDELLGLLNVYHDRPHTWTESELDTMAALASQAGMAIKTGQHYARMATWAAQLQSIQQLGARLSGLTSVQEIGHAIATELHQLIESHNVRVYRLQGDELLPVAMQGQVGEYVDETPEQLKVRMGEGITGWVAEHRIAQNLPDAAKDPRASTIPGTEDDLDESMLLAPMIHEDQVLGVLVLSKLGLNQFRGDDLRLLVIYASIAAQAMANADATQKLREQSATLERQLRSQRELLRITESILSTLDPRAVLDQIAERIGTIVPCDNIAIEAVDAGTGLLTPLVAKGIHADYYIEPWEEGETGIATWVVGHNEPVLILDQAADQRVNHSPAFGPLAGSLIVVPLRSRGRATGVLTLERVGEGAVFTHDEFELVQLFAAQVSIALQNAEVHRAVEIRARTDDLTGLLNHGTFREWLGSSVGAGEPFSLVMIDLDDFKAVNDALGHQAGDRLLGDIARVLESAGRDTDHVFRYGGDEFVLLLPRTDGPAAMSVAERVLSAIDTLGRRGGRWRHQGLSVSASLGVASYPADGATADALLLAADRACFVAKRAGGDRIATADEGLALAAEFSLKEPTPVDSPSEPAA